MTLEEFYAGDEKWHSFVAAHAKSPLSGDFFNEQLDDPDQKHLADYCEFVVVAISYFGRSNAYKWLNLQLNDLENLSPLACMRNPTLHRRLRVYMMQLPC